MTLPLPDFSVARPANGGTPGHRDAPAAPGIPMTEWFAADASGSRVPIRAVAGEHETVDAIAAAVLSGLVA